MPSMALAIQQRRLFLSSKGKVYSVLYWTDPAVKEGTVTFIGLHGFVGEGMDWEQLAYANQTSFACRWLAPDWPGHGASDPPAALDHFVDCLVATVANAPKSGKVVLIGYSMGGRLLLYALSRCPILRNYPCVFIGTNPGVTDIHARAQRRLDDQKWVDLLNSGSLSLFLRAWADQPVLRSQASMPEPWLQRMQSRRLNANPRHWATVLQLTGQGSLPCCWQTIPILPRPSLWLAGEHDSKYTELASAAAAANNRATFHSVPNAGHSPHWEHPHATLDVIQQWLRAF